MTESRSGTRPISSLIIRRGITTVSVGNTVYALIASTDDDGVQIVDITTPDAPVPVTSFRDGDSVGMMNNTYDALVRAFDITTAVIGNTVYALVTSNDKRGGGVQIVSLNSSGAMSETTPPTFSVDGETGDYTTDLELGGTYTPGMISDIDDASGTDGGRITGVGGVDTTMAGTYLVIYNVTDNASPPNSHTITETVKVGDDTTPPTVVSATYATGDGTLTITFDEALDPGSTVYTRLHVRDTGSISGGVTLGSGTTSGNTVSATLSPAQIESVARMESPRLDIDAGAVRDTSENQIAATPDKPIRMIDTTAPEATDVTTHDRRTIVMTMSEDVNASGSAGFTVHGVASDPLVVSVGAADNTVTLGLDSDMLDSDSPSLAYDDGTGGIADLSSQPLASFNKTVRNTLDTTAPTVRSVTIDGSGTVRVNLSESVLLNSALPEHFKTNNTSITISTVTVSGSTVTLKLSGEIPGDAALTLGYDGAAGRIADHHGNHLEPFEEVQITKQSRSRSTVTSTPAVDLASVQSLGYMDSNGTAMPHDPHSPIAPLMNTGDSSGFAMAINDMYYLLGGSLNTLEPTTLLTGTPNTISFVVYDRADVAHFTLHMNLHGQDSDYRNSDTYVTYDMGNIRTVDPHDIISDAAVSVKTVKADSLIHTVTFTITFEGEMEQTNLVARTWNTDASSAIVRVLDAFSVSAAQPDPPAALPEDPAPEDPAPEDPAPEDPAPEDPAPEDPMHDAGGDSDESDLLAIRMWAGFEPESITDAELLAALGLNYQGGGADIPPWMMTELGPLVAKGEITVGEFRTALEYVLDYMPGDA